MAQAIETKGTNPQSGGVLNTIVGTGLGLLTANYNDRRQERLNKKYMRQQTAQAQEMGRFNQGLALEMWEKTGYGAQRKQMQDAGLNVGLMYGGAGSGGTTQGGQSQMPTSAVAPGGGNEIGMGIQSAMAMAMMKAQIENTEADTELKKTEAGKTGGVDTAKAGAEVENIMQQTKNAKINESLMKYQEAIAQIETRIKQNTDLDAIEAVKLANEETKEEIRKTRADANVKEGTQDEIIKQLNTASQEQALRIEGQKLGLIKTTAETDAIKQSISKMVSEVNMMIQGNMREWDKMSQKDKEIAISQKVMEVAKQNADFNTSTPQQIKQWTDLLISVGSIGLPTKKIGF